MHYIEKQFSKKGGGKKRQSVSTAVLTVKELLGSRPTASTLQYCMEEPDRMNEPALPASHSGHCSSLSPNPSFEDFGAL